MRKKQRMTFWMEKQQIEGLKTLHMVTRIPQAVLMREAVDMLLSKYRKEMEKAKSARKALFISVIPIFQ